jgi:hypothetical protein
MRQVIQHFHFELMRYLVPVVMIFISSPALADVPVKTWHMTNVHGDITLELELFSYEKNGETTLHFKSEGESIQPTSDELRLLGQALDEMPALGYDTRKIVSITIFLQRSEYQPGVEHVVAESMKWKSCIGMKYCHEAEPIADRYLRSVDAFNSFDDALRAHGIVRRSFHVDDMGLGERLGKIFCDGLIFIFLSQSEAAKAGQ